jgi:excisionase family DNA binding protein
MSKPTVARPSDREIWSLEDVCVYLGMSAPTVRKLVRTQGLPFVDFGNGKLTRFRRVDVTAWIEKRRKVQKNGSE